MARTLSPSTQAVDARGRLSSALLNFINELARRITSLEVELRGNQQRIAALVEAGEEAERVRRSLEDRIATLERTQPRRGPPGRDGDTGPPGPPGTDGVPGAPGQSIPGPPGQDGQDGRDGTDGTNGRDGQPGPKGDKGDKGDDGPEGPVGPAGTNATC